jgi:hypothetical protein
VNRINSMMTARVPIPAARTKLEVFHGGRDGFVVGHFPRGGIGWRVRVLSDEKPSEDGSRLRPVTITGRGKQYQGQRIESDLTKTMRYLQYF